jgi:glutamine amidotransferase
MKRVPRVAVIDYGLGNLYSVVRGLEVVGSSPYLVDSGASFNGADALVLPGVGAFGDAMANMRSRGLDEVVRRAFETNVPIMGVCLGLQLAFEESMEFGCHTGLGLIKGRVVRLPGDQSDRGRILKVPRIGWQEVSYNSQGPKMLYSAKLPSLLGNAYFYFVHSFYAADVPESHVLATSRFGDLEYCCAAHAGSFVGFQFHPEKSGEAGLALYRDWIQHI